MNKKYPITWYKNVIKVTEKLVIDLGICGYSGKVAFIDVRKGVKLTKEDLEYVAITDISIEDSKCLGGKYCFDIDCPLNEASINYFTEYYGIKTIDRLEEIHRLLEEAREKLDLKPMELGVLGKFDEPPLYLTPENK
mgnify:CR=1 FL=1